MEKINVFTKDLSKIASLCAAGGAKKVGLFNPERGEVKVFGLLGRKAFFESAIPRMENDSLPIYSEFPVNALWALSEINEPTVTLGLFSSESGAPTIFDYGYVFEAWLPNSVLSLKDVLQKSKIREKERLFSFLMRNFIKGYRNGSFQMALWRGRGSKILKIYDENLSYKIFL